MQNLVNMWPIVLVWVALLVAFVLIVIRPRKREVAQHREFLASLKVGEKVVTVGGMYGEIVDLTDDTVRLRVAPTVEITMDRRAVRRRQRESA